MLTEVNLKLLISPNQIHHKERGSLASSTFQGGLEGRRSHASMRDLHAKDTQGELKLRQKKCKSTAC